MRGTERDFFVLHSPDWVNALALTPDGGLLMVNQFRYGTQDFSWEIPGGLVDPGEDPIVAAARELLEETGYGGTCRGVIGRVSPNPAILNNTCHFVLFEDCTRQAEVDWDTDEEIAVEVRPVAQALRDAATGALRHALTLDALLFLIALRPELAAALPGAAKAAPVPAV